MGNSETDERHVLELSDPAQFLDGDTCRHFVGKHGRQPSPLRGWGWGEERHAGPFGQVLNNRFLHTTSSRLTMAAARGAGKESTRRSPASRGPFPGGRPRSGRPPKMAAAPRLGRLPRAWSRRRASQRGHAGGHARTPSMRTAPLRSRELSWDIKHEGRR